MCSIHKFIEIMQKEYNVPKKYLSIINKQKMDELIEKAIDCCYELRTSGYYPDPPDYDGDGDCDDPINDDDKIVYDKLPELIKEEWSAIIIQNTFLKKRLAQKTPF